MVVICNKPYPSESPKYQQYFDMFPYELSDFQKYAIEAIVEGQHSLITAHTGSGKSLPAEFAIQFFHQKGKKTIYTSPIKALSNQKYYEFTQKYPNITFGLITGDIKINPTADVLIMTAEILLNCLFVSQPEKMENSATSDTSATFQININTELACVVMDEIHYINDRDRGAVWEKTILLLPPHIQMIMLSATIDSPELFAAWCERGGGGDGEAPQKKVYLSSTNTRIVPLIHYGYLVTTETFYKKVKDKAIQQQMRNSTNRLIPIKDSDGKYNPSAFLELKSVKKLLDTNEISIKRNYVLNQLCTFLKDRDMFPAIAFVFSRKNVELYAKEITANLLEDDSKIPYIVARECEQILRKLPNYKEYLELPEYIQLVALLEKGVGIHHSGMIPILREIVELMISKRYIKLLFATESFAIGLNCPIRTAIFTSLTKFDGNYDRLLLPHEYNQAASRCGRRGIDTIGHVIHCNNLFDLPTDSEYRELLCGKPQSLISKFCISMPLVLTLLKTPSNITTICEFVEKSMMQMRLIESQTYCIKEIAIVESMIEKQKSSLQFLRTPIEICQEYNRFIVLAPTLVNKKRKEVERNIQQLLCNYKYIKEDSLKINGLSLLEQRLENERENLYTLENFISTKIRIILDLLENNKFVGSVGSVGSVESYKEENHTIYFLTKKGQMAAILAEINPILFVEFMLQTDYMENLTTIQIIQFLSCFTDIKVLGDIKSIVPSKKDAKVKSAVLKFEEIKKVYMKYEENYQIISSNNTNSDSELCYDLMDIIEEWCIATDEPQCKWFIQTKLGEKGISIGDFTKAILKISTITRELMNLCEQFELVILLSKLAHIDGIILKYITTAQSLYV